MAFGSRKNKKKRSILESRLDPNAERDAVSAEHEAVTARALGGNVQRASGATERHKGDVKTSDFLIENKTRLPSSRDGARSMSIKADWLEKISREALAEGKDPALAFQITGIDDPSTEQRWIAVPESVFARMLE